MSVPHPATVDQTALESDNAALHRFEDDGCPNFPTERSLRPLNQMHKKPIPPHSTTGGSLRVGCDQQDGPNLTMPPFYRHLKAAWFELRGDLRALNHTIRDVTQIGCDTGFMLRRKAHLLKALCMVQVADRELTLAITPTDDTVSEDASENHVG